MEWRLNIIALILLLLISIVAFLLLSDQFIAPKHHPQEPPLVPQRIPYVGHVAGLFLHGMKYFEFTSAKCRSPAYTLNVLSAKLYVVQSPELVTAVSRNSKSLSFNPFISEIGIRLTEADQATRVIIDDNLNGERGPWGYVVEVHDRTVEALNLGKGLDSMLNSLMTKMAEQLEASNDEFTKGTVSLYAWTRHIFTICSTTALYGSNSPFLTQPELERAFWEFDADLNLLLVNIAPAFIARKGHHGRRKLANAFKRYFETDPTGKSSALAEARYAVNQKFGLSKKNMGRLEVGSLIGILVNTVPAFVYLLYHVFSDKSLLKDLRAELDSIMSKDESDTKLLNLDISLLKEKCLLLTSTFQEVLRVYAQGASARLVVEETLLNNQYLLKKGAVLMIPQSVMHSDTSVWGSNDFDPRRFFSQGSKRSSAASYRPFGGGATLCPGRHFATTEILAVAAMMIYKHELSPACGQWRLPTPYQTSLATNIFPPKTDIEVRISTRPGMEDTRWSFVSSG